jgi:hypothetical protein
VYAPPRPQDWAIAGEYSTARTATLISNFFTSVFLLLAATKAPQRMPSCAALLISPSSGSEVTPARVVESPGNVAAVVDRVTDAASAGVVIAHDAATPGTVDNETTAGVVSRRCVAVDAEGHVRSVHATSAEVGRLGNRTSDSDGESNDTRQ